MKRITKLLSSVLIGISIVSISAFAASTQALNYNETTSATQLSILNGAGNVNLSYSAGSEVKITATLMLSGGSGSEQATKREQLVLIPELVGTTLLVEAKAQDGTDYWTWLRKNLNVDNVKINYEVSIPSGVQTVKVYNAVGNVTANGIKSSLDIEVYTGHITGISLAPQNYTSAISHTGNIKMTYSDTSNAALLKSTVYVGSITVKMPSDARYTANDALADPQLSKVNDVFSDSNISRILGNLLSASQYGQTTTIVANQTELGLISVQ